MKHEQAGKAGTGILCISMTLLSWASVPLFLKYFTAYIDAWTANGWRYAVSALFWSPVLFWGMKRRSLPPELWRKAILPSLFNSVGQTCFAFAPYFIDPGLMSFLLRWQIVVIAIGAYLLFPGERGVIRSSAYWLGIGLVVVGSIGTILLGDSVPRGATLTGVILALAAGLLFAGYALTIKRNMHGIASMVSFAAISTLTSVLLVSAMLIWGRQHGADAMHLARGQMIMLVVSSLIGIAFAHVFYYASIARLGVAVSSGIILLSPFLAAIGSLLIYQERLSVFQWISGTLAMLGAASILYAQSRLPPSLPTSDKSPA